MDREVQFSAVEGSHISDADAAIIGRELLRIERAGGLVTAWGVLDEARNAASPLHRFFEWNDGQAAEQWRVEQARRMLRSVRIQFVDAPKQEPVRAFHVVTTEGEGRGYASIPRIVVDQDLTKQLVEQAKRDLATWRRRYQRLAKIPELAAVFEAVDQAVAATQTDKRATESRAEVMT